MTTETRCIRCNRPRQTHDERWHPFLDRVPDGSIVRVVHAGYGCDTGCCGHYWIIDGPDGHEILEGKFDFSHFYSSLHAGQTREDWIRDFVEEAVREHGVTIDFENSDASND